MQYLIYNSKANEEKTSKVKSKVKKEYGESVISQDILKIDDFNEFFNKLNENDEIILVGGDGTLFHFANKYKQANAKCKVSFASTGTGNDFARDLEKEPLEIVEINKYLENLPVVKINDQEYNFLNGIGFGIDGYCCEQGDIQREKSTEPVNYTTIAINGLLFKFKPRKAKITVDGVVKEYSNVWIASTMKGRFYGGGMKIAPEQDRLSEDGKVTVVVFFCKFNLKALIMFPSIFKGELQKHAKNCETITGYNIEVEFNKPTPLQVDGETFKNITKYSVKAK